MQNRTSIPFFALFADLPVLSERVASVCVLVGLHTTMRSRVSLGVLEAAVAQGNAEAQCWLGTMYFTGEGVPKDLQHAAQLYTAAADQGHAKAQCRLGYCSTAS